MVEARLRGYRADGQDDKTIVILKAFIEYLPRNGARNVMEDILGCKSDEIVKELAGNLRTGVLGLMNSRGRTPLVLPSPRFNAQQDLEEIASEFDGVYSRNNQDWLKMACLQREGGRCAITGLYDVDEFEKLPESERVGLFGDVTTQATHILPFSLGSSNSSNSDRVWDVIYRCFPSIRARLNFSPSAINDTCNAMTMWGPFHEMFGKFKFALESTQTANTYRIKTYYGFVNVLMRDIPPNGLVTFTSHGNLHPLPSPILLEAHASIAQILHATGMGDLIEKILREGDKIPFLATNGTTNLERLLWMI